MGDRDLSDLDALVTALGVLAISALLVAVLCADILLDRAAAWAHRRLDQWKEKYGIIWR